MEFPKIGDKYRSNSSGLVYKVIGVNNFTKIITLQGSDKCKIKVENLSLIALYRKIPPKIELGSRWLLPNGRLITVSSKDHGRINYYFGEAYCFSKVRFSKYESIFLSDCSPFTGNLNDYNHNGIKKKQTCGTREFYSSTSVDVQGDRLAPFYTGVITNDGGQFPIYTDHQYLKEPVEKPPTNIEKKPLWKRILRKLV